MSKKTRLNLDDLKVQSFVTTIEATEQAAMFGAATTDLCSHSLACQTIYVCPSQLRCETGECSGSNTDDLTCVPDTTYCTYYEPWKC